jgi:hypothetical protein
MKRANIKKGIIKNQIREKQLKLRKRLWPEIDDSHLWLRNQRDGFTTIPRTMPIISEIMDSLSKNKPVSSTYLELWCRAFDECFVTMNKHTEQAFHAGFSGQRAVNTWKERLKILAELGFIDIKPGPSGDISYVLIYNPYLIIKRLFAEKRGISQQLYNTLTARAIEIKADDLDEDEGPIGEGDFDE